MQGDRGLRAGRGVRAGHGGPASVHLRAHPGLAVRPGLVGALAEVEKAVRVGADAHDLAVPVARVLRSSVVDGGRPDVVADRVDLAHDGFERLVDVAEPTSVRNLDDAGAAVLVVDGDGRVVRAPAVDHVVGDGAVELAVRHEVLPAAAGGTRVRREEERALPGEARGGRVEGLRRVRVVHDVPGGAAVIAGLEGPLDGVAVRCVVGRHPVVRGHGDGRGEGHDEVAAGEVEPLVVVVRGDVGGVVDLAIDGGRRQLTARVLAGVLLGAAVVAEAAGAEGLEADRVGGDGAGDVRAVGAEELDLGDLDAAVPAAEAGLVVGGVEVELEDGRRREDGSAVVAAALVGGRGNKLVGRARLDAGPVGGARDLNVQLGVAVAAALEAEALEVVVARVERDVVDLHVAPDIGPIVVAGRAVVDAVVAAAAVVGVEAEVVGVGADRGEGDDGVEADADTTAVVAAGARVLPVEALGDRELLGARPGGAGARVAFVEGRQGRRVVARVVVGVVGALGDLVVDAAEGDDLAARRGDGVAVAVLHLEVHRRRADGPRVAADVRLGPSAIGIVPAVAAIPHLGAVLFAAVGGVLSAVRHAS